MKKLILGAMVLLSSQAFAAPSLYLVEPMICKGRITNINNQVAPSYYQMGLQLESFRSMRRDGTLANSLEIQTTYAPIDQELDMSRLGSERWFLKPLRREGNQVVLNNVTGRSDNLTLTIVQSRKLGGYSHDTLIGTYNLGDSVAGSYGYRLKCSATVVRKASKILDYTRR